MLSDPVYLHAMLFSSEAYADIRLGRGRSDRTVYHFMETLRLLQNRISLPDDPRAVADPTIMTVIMLALAAETLGDSASAKQHLEGLQRMVSLRGGFAMFRSPTHELATKICR